MHLTVRMAWHDTDWNGRVCQNPQANSYCTGAHSLLSGRIEKNKNTELEQRKKGDLAGSFNPGSVPPCYWSINAFGQRGFKVEHHHAFTNDEQPISKIADKVKPYSVFTWPFKLSFVHNPENKKKHGSYWPNLDKRVRDFIGSFTPRKSVLFFYANYDNPVSADEMKYLLLGCSLISELPKPTHFPFSKEELEQWRSSGKRINGGVLKMKNFPSMNWALQFTHDPERSVLLPYREYIAYAEQHVEDEETLHDMKVIIEEESLIRGFKYVAMDIDDDKCLYLLYKLRRSLSKIRDHNGLVVKADLAKQEQRLNDLIAMTWKTRGIYPGLAGVLHHFLNDEKTSSAAAIALAKLTTPENDLLTLFKRILANRVPRELAKFKNDLLEIAESRLFKKNVEAFARLSLFKLTQNQIDRIVEQPALLKQIATNPYSLYEEYMCENDDLDSPLLQDEPIDLYKIDIGMIPDRRFVKRHRNLQSLAEDSPERIRSVYMNYLQRIGNEGHCYDHTGNLIAEVKENPLIYKMEKVTIDEQALTELDTDYRSHFMEKLDIVRGDGIDFYYLKDVREAEQRINRIVNELLARRDHAGTNFDAGTAVSQALRSSRLKSIIVTEGDKTLFSDERRQLYRNVFSKSFFLLTGKPGSGKTFEAAKVIEHLHSMHEGVEILAPTGKAVLRITDMLRANANLSHLAAKTIDKFLFDHFRDVMSGKRGIETIQEAEKITVENLILDECSMLDLEKLNVLFSVIRFTPKLPKRIIMVGDENQLPPIGFGKPFHDIIGYILADQNRASRHYVNLTSNCRQENDPTILALADAFTDKRRYAESALDLLNKTGWVSQGLYVGRWSDTRTLNDAIKEAMSDLFRKEGVAGKASDIIRLNNVFGLYDNGNVNNQNYAFRDHLNLEALQLLTPYRGGYYGTLGLNKLIQTNYRARPTYSWDQSVFYPADKIIRLTNWYQGWGENRRLVLSNGSIGVCKGDGDSRMYYFRELDRPWSYVGDEEDYDLAYAISVHRSQGSDFKNVLLIIPRKKALLCRELIYTALTRSKFRLFLFVQDGDENPLLQARLCSHLVGRNTSIFKPPADNRAVLVPEPRGKPVKSRVEYIIYQSLKRSGLKFHYERTLPLAKRNYDIHPDFTIELPGGKTVYWEHLGMLDVRKYYRDWQQRIVDYKDHSLFDQVVTTDDLDGIKQEKIDGVINAIRDYALKQDNGNRFSSHHYELY